MTEWPIYPALVSTALGVAVAVSQFSAIPFGTAMVLISAGVLVSGLAGYRPPPPASGAALRGALQRQIAGFFRITLGTAAIALMTLAALHAFGRSP